MILLEYPAEMNLPQREADESHGRFEFGGQLFTLGYHCGNCGEVHEVIFGFDRLQPHDDGARKVYKFGGIAV